MKKTIIESAEITGINTLKLIISGNQVLDKNKIKITNCLNETIEISNMSKDKNIYILEVPEIKENRLPYEFHYENLSKEFRLGFSYIDALYAYDGDDLGPTLNDDGSAVLKLWSPLAKDVKVVLYDKDDQDKIIDGDIQMTLEKTGVWTVELNETNCNIANLDGYYYHYKIEHDGKRDYDLLLDPYAKSMAPFDNKKYNIGKGAIINPSKLGISLNYAQIPNFKKKEDAIIYEIHVRDFTVDPSIEKKLNSRFGTFRAFIDRLSYLKDLGITHIQLLPIMSYYICNEFKACEREMHWSARDNNYNWGYDPHSYFSLSGMYSENPENPKLRISELKELVGAIHKEGMGVILDVVYNHTSSLHILEDLMPNYYHFMDHDGSAKTSFGGGRLGTTHAMARKILLDSICYWTKEFKVDGFRFDMMGDHDAESIQMAYDKAKKLNPNLIMIGEGWRTFAGDSGDPRQPADQDWMAHTDIMGVFSDEFRDELKSGYNSEGEPRFITGGKRDIGLIFKNIKGQPSNFETTQPGNVVPYIEAHDNLTLHDVVSLSIKKDPALYEEEIHRRIRIGNTLLLTSQGTAFIHGGQEYGRSKQWLDDNSENIPVWKETYAVDETGKPFKHPYFIHDTYDSTDIINMFNWEKVLNKTKYPVSTLTKEYTKGLIAIRKSTDAFKLGSKELVNSNIKLIWPKADTEDVIISYSVKATSGEEYFVFINGDDKKREFKVDADLRKCQVLADEKEAGLNPIANPSGVTVEKNSVTLAPLTAIIIKK